MRLFLAVAVLFLAFVAYAEAQDRSIEDRLQEVREHVTTFGSNIFEKTKAVVEDIGNSEVVTKSKNWLQKTFEDLQNRLRGQ